MAEARSLEELAELVCEEARFALGARTVSLSRLEPEHGLVRTLVNVGALAPDEERFPVDETYQRGRLPAARADGRRGDGRGGCTWTTPSADPAERALLLRARGRVGAGGPAAGRAAGCGASCSPPARCRTGRTTTTTSPSRQAFAGMVSAGLAQVEHLQPGAAAGVPRPAHRPRQPPAGRGRAGPGARGAAGRRRTGHCGHGGREPAQAGQRQPRARGRRPGAGVRRARALGGLRPGARRGGRADRRGRVLRGAARFRDRGRRGSGGGLPARDPVGAVRRERGLRGRVDRAVRRSGRPGTGCSRSPTRAVRGQAEPGRAPGARPTRRRWRAERRSLRRGTRSRRCWPRVLAALAGGRSGRPVADRDARGRGRGGGRACRARSAGCWTGSRAGAAMPVAHTVPDGVYLASVPAPAGAAWLSAARAGGPVVRADDEDVPLAAVRGCERVVVAAAGPGWPSCSAGRGTAVGDAGGAPRGTGRRARRLRVPALLPGCRRASLTP